MAPLGGGGGPPRYISRDSRWGGWLGVGMVAVRFYPRYTSRAVVEGIRIGVVREFS